MNYGLRGTVKKPRGNGYLNKKMLKPYFSYVLSQKYNEVTKGGYGE